MKKIFAMATVCLFMASVCAPVSAAQGTKKGRVKTEKTHATKGEKKPAESTTKVKPEEKPQQSTPQKTDNKATKSVKK